LLEGVPGGHQTRTGVALGTLAYMAPEQALGRRGEIDGRVDVFALGATMFRVLAGRRVHEAESEAELLMAMASRPAPPLGSVAPGTPPGICAIVDLSLAFARDARYPDARTMLSDVQAVRHGANPPFASARLAYRDERTRAEAAAPGASLGAVTVPNTARTQPLSAYTEATAPYPAGVPVPASNAPTAYGAAQDLGAASVRAPASMRTEPLPAMAPGPGRAPPPVVAVAVAPVPHAGGAVGGGAPYGAPPVAAWPSVPAPPAAKGRALLALLVVLGTLALACVGGVIAYFVLVRGAATSGGPDAPLPAALPSPGATTATADVPTAARAADGRSGPVTLPEPTAPSVTTPPAPRVPHAKSEAAASVAPSAGAPAPLAPPPTTSTVTASAAASPALQAAPSAPVAPAASPSAAAVAPSAAPSAPPASPPPPSPPPSPGSLGRRGRGRH
jgi:serine/threonine-protein kinase